MPTLPNSNHQSLTKILFVRIRVLPAAAAALIIFVFSWGCTKLDTTNLGTDLIPAVDNVHTFRDTFSIGTTQGFFNDTSVVSNTNNHALGVISNDPLFGRTEANMYFQLKPAFFPFYFGSAGDTVKNYTGTGIDSVVLCLSYKGIWGDTNTVQQLQVFEVTDQLFSDSVTFKHDVNYQPQIGAPLSGIVTVDPRRIKDSVWFNNRKDSITNQIRIRLDNNFAQQLFAQDSSDTAVQNAFATDSLFKRKYHGFAVKALSGNGLMYISLTDAATRLEVHYRKFRREKYDTTYNSFVLHYQGSLVTNSATANYVHRDRAGSESANPAADAVYLQGSPGSYVNLHFPALYPDSFTNRIVHRAEIIIEQIPNNNFYDSIFSPPLLYLDLVDTAAQKWKPLYADLNPSISYNPDDKTYYYPGEVDHNYFGGITKSKINQLGQNIHYYNLNVTRYMQRVCSGKSPNYDLRLYAPFKFSYPQYAKILLQYDNPVGFGRIKVGSGTNSNYRMRMVMTWTKL